MCTKENEIENRNINEKERNSDLRKRRGRKE